MKKFKKIFLILVVALVAGGCYIYTQSSEGVIADEGSSEAMQNTKTITGQVTEVYGNEVTLTLSASGTTGGVNTANPNGERPQSQPSTDESGEENTAEMPEGASPPEMGELSTEDRAAMREQAMAGAENSTMASQEGTATRTTPEGATGEGGASSGRGSMSGAGGGMMSGGMGTTGVSDSIELSDESETYLIPIGTPVLLMGNNMTFSQITEEMYINIVTDEFDTIVSVEILG